MKDTIEYKKRNWVIGYTIGCLLLWSIFVVLAGQWEIRENHRRTVKFASYHALSTFQMMNLYIRQDAKENATSGNSDSDAYIEQEKQAYGHLIHIVSLDPARSKNIPDTWETQALESIQNGAFEVSSQELIHGRLYQRLIKSRTERTGHLIPTKPDSTQADCITAISVAVPMEPLWEISRLETHNLLSGYTAVWCIGSLVIMFGHLYLKRHCKKHLQNEQRLIKEIENAEDNTARKSEFMANLSHEFRTPMNAIIGFTDLLIEEELTDEQKEYLQTVQNSGKGLLELLNDVLDISKIESGRLKIVKEQVTLQSSLEDVRSMMQPGIEGKGLTFQLQKQMGTPDTIYTDALRLKQCLINLINNAMKFTKKGSIKLIISSYFERKQQWFRFDVQDTGIGIPADKQQDIFREFVQAEDTTAHKYGGTGLGLCITLQLTELLGGRITMQSQEGQGTMFSIHLPIEEPAAEQDVQIQKSSASNKE